MGSWRVARDRGIKFLDITAKSGIALFAPDFSLVMGYKNGSVSEEEYTRHYLDKMMRSQRSAPNYWNNLQRYHDIAFACYCPPDVFCHRHLFRDLASEHLIKLGHSVELMGELQK